MPLFESICDECRVAVEWIGRYDQAEPFCGGCGREMRRAPSRFAVVWTGALSAGKYNNKKLEYPESEGHWIYSRTRKQANGKPERYWIDSHEKRRKIMKQEGLVGVEDLGSKFEPSSTGKHPGTDIKVEHDPTVTITRGPAE